MRRAASEWLGWFVFAAMLTAPAWFRGDLLGHPDIDVWNHVWGLWWWADTLASGELPWRTALLSTPHGGVLWFADPLGALAAMPVTLLAGPTVAWNLLLITRIAWAGFHARRFAGLLGTPGPHTIVAGVAFATSPYLLCELYNGISEVCATGWVPLVLAQWLMAMRTRSSPAWVLAGLCLGGATWATPYYGAALLLGLAPATLVGLGRSASSWRIAVPGLLAAGLLTGGALWTWRSALVAKEAVIQRDEGSERAVARHNAVDIREPFVPGGFQSVDFEAEYGGEQFKHTVYLRWSLLLLAAVAVWRRPREVFPWVALALWGLVLGLGERLFVAGAYPLGERGPLLPFGLLTRLVPDLAITHPARLAVTAHAILASLAADGLRAHGRRGLVVLPLVVGETLGFSLAAWPLPGAPAAVPGVYERIAASDDPRAVLDLPAQVRQTMATSVYFWYQTVHQHPVPWWPNVRAEGNGDAPTVRLFLPARTGPRRVPELSPVAVAGLRAHYGWVLVHPALDARAQLPGESTRVLTTAFGPPEEVDGVRLWTLR
ncbi:MAG: hypothetical protein EXR71_14790 [Myxococcales bacterium]|nr:hypothetical protein [Myxococcales bacterium]